MAKFKCRVPLLQLPDVVYLCYTHGLRYIYASPVLSDSYGYLNVLLV